MKKFSILIPSWNNLPYLKLCVQSIRNNSHYAHQVIVHVNEGIDGSLEWIGQQSDIQYTYSTENLGVCYALNRARALVDTSYIMYMNDDMYVCPGWDIELHRAIEEIGHNQFFISSTAIEPVASSDCAIEKDFGSSIESFREKELLNQYAQLEKSDWQGSTWPPNVVHRDTWDLVGGYSVEFSPGMYSDPDFSMKLWKAGVRLFKGLGKSKVYHFGSKSTARVSKNAGYYMFIAKWGITSSTLTTHYLKRGRKYNGPLEEPKLSAWLRAKNIIRRIDASLRK